MTDFSELHNLYWFIRYTRIRSVKRKYYRRVAKEKKRLLEAGIDKEELRLLCRFLSNLRNERAENRLISYRKTRQIDQISYAVDSYDLT